MQSVPQNSFEERVTEHGDSHVTSHELTFLFVLESIKGKAPAEESSEYKALQAADEALYEELPKSIEGWLRRDQDDVEIAALEIFQPEFGHDPAVDESVRLYTVTVGAHHELPATQEQVTERRPLSVERLVAVLPETIASVYAKHHVALKLHDIQFVKKMVSSVYGSIVR